MDFIELRTTFTVISFVVFLGIMWWAYNGHQSKGFAEAARIPFEEDDDLPQSLAAGEAIERKEYRS